jgi:hypothetical protein
MIDGIIKRFWCTFAGSRGQSNSAFQEFQESATYLAMLIFGKRKEDPQYPR